MTPEERAREKIDALLSASGWVVQTSQQINLSAAAGVAICELSFATGEPDYTLFVDGKAIGTVEAKPVGITLIGVEEQSTKYVAGVRSGVPAWHNLRCRFATRAPEPKRSSPTVSIPSHAVAACSRFHRPETLLAWVQQEKQLAQRLQRISAAWLKAIFGPLRSKPSRTWKPPSPRVVDARSSRWRPARARPTPPSISFIAS